MRIDVVKYLFMGPTSSRDLFFEKVQELGIIEFISEKGGFKQKDSEIDLFIHALHILRRRTPVEQLARGRDVRSGIVVASDIVDKNERLERAREEKRILEKEIARIEIFGDFSLDELHAIENESKRVFQFFFTKKSREIEAPKRPEVFYVGEHFGLDYYVSLNPERVSYEGMTEMMIDHSVGELQSKLAEVNRNIDLFEGELSILAHYKKDVKAGLVDALNRQQLHESREKTEFHLEGGLFAVSGWIPKNKIPLLKQLEEQLDIVSEPVALEPTDRIPTYLENQGSSKLGEDLVSIYDTPSAFDRDPSLWVFVAFGLFFSMIIGDAGYGLILLGISLFLYKKWGKKPGLARRVILLSASLSIGCIIWGVITASFFGIKFPPDSKMRSLSFIDWMVDKKAEYLIAEKPEAYQELVKQHPILASQTEPYSFVTAVIQGEGKLASYPIHEEFADNVMMEIVILIGALHLMLSLLRYADRNWSAFGWVLFIIGAYLYFPSLLKAVSLIHYLFHIPPVLGAEIGYYLLLGGIGLATVLALIQKKWAGLVEPMQVIQVFADVMSYLRIYALALAGVIMAQTFNNIASKAPLIFGILIILAGHGVNFTLALMGGLIHGLRLNFIEWYHYSFEGGGKPFDPLALKKLD
jgi:V/A-type H+-transporting ATPase subunit I